MEEIFVRSDFMDTLQRLDLMHWDDPYFRGYYRNRKGWTPVYIKSHLGTTLGKLYGVRQWPKW